MSVGQLETLLNGLASEADGFRVATRLVMSGSERRIEQCVLRVMGAHADGLFDVVYGLVGSGVEGKRAAEKAVRGGKVRIEIKRAHKFLDRFVGVPPGKGHESQRKVCPRIAIVELHRAGSEAGSLRDLRLHHVPSALA